jgi:iron complex transport system ATP-binding protein
MVADMSIIEVRDITFDYGHGNIFEDLSFKVEKGEIFCLIGPNGSGKTTLLDCILGTLKLKKGVISIDGKDISALGPRRLARSLSYVPQRHDSAFSYSVIEMAMMGRAAYTDMFSTPTARDREIAEDALGLVGIGHLRERPYTQLSGGELQLVMLARALAQESPVIVMDEPTSHLDYRHELVILETITGLVRKKGITVIIATHFPNHAFYFEDVHGKTEMAMLRGGSFLAKGRPRDVLNVENIRMLYGIESNLLSYRLKDGKEQKLIIPVRTMK